MSLSLLSIEPPTLYDLIPVGASKSLGSPPFLPLNALANEPRAPTVPIP